MARGRWWCAACEAPGGVRWELWQRGRNFPNPKLPGTAVQQWGHLVRAANRLRLPLTSEDTAFSNVNDHAEPGREQSGRSPCLQGGEVGEAARLQMRLWKADRWRPGRGAAGRKEPLGNDGSVHYLEGGDGFTGVWGRQHRSSCTR